jgi:4-carboxymuconolactone decarboxylase
MTPDPGTDPEAGRDDVPGTGDRRAAGLAKMAEVYGWDEVGDAPGDFFGMTVEHLFGDVWTREGLSLRDRRLLVIGLLMGLGEHDVVDMQIDSALNVGDLDGEDLREIVIFLTHYVGWPRGAKLNTSVEKHLSRRARTD